MPLTAKGEETLASMKGHYGPKKGESVFYASINKGTITGAEADQADRRPEKKRRKGTDFDNLK